MKDKAKILVVEADTPLAMLMVGLLTQAGCNVEAAWTGKTAIERASETKFDLIALDSELPDMTGFEICSDLKQRHISWKTPVVVIGASSRPDDIDEAKRRGAVDYLAKPVDPTELIYKVIYHAKAKMLKDGVSTAGEAVV
jgi:CheY-like chemotaxis protein